MRGGQTAFDSGRKGVWCPGKDRRRAAQPMAVALPESSCSDEETAARRDSAPLAAKHASGSNVGKVQPLQAHIFCAEDIQIAPIFFQRRKSKPSSDGELQKPVERLQKPALPPQSGDVQQAEGRQRSSVVPHLAERRGSWRGQVSPSALRSCLEHIQTSNPAFPVQTVFSTLQRKASERLQDVGSTEHFLAQSSPQNRLKEKRKRGNESSERVPKRPRWGLAAEGVVGTGHRHVSAQGVQESAVPTVKKQPRSNKLSRTHRLRQQRLSPAGLKLNNCEPYSGSINHKESDSQSLKTSDILQRESSFEDALWTDKYSPQHSSEVIGNSVSVKKLQCWLKKWKQRADCDERRKMEERKREENSNNSWDCGDFQGEAGAEDDREGPLCNTVLITGPTGVGKTASVYACSQELGFKVFEVNCSSQRSGRHVLSQLKEATQSHLVEMSGKDPLKPTYFNNYNINSCTPKSDTLPGKTATPKNVTSTSKKRATRNLGRSSRKGKANPPTVTLANYFKMKAKADHFFCGGLSPSETPGGKKSVNQSPGSDQTVAQNKKTATSLILFEEVDVIFDDDVGFLAAIKTFMTTTKRPVILTTNDPSFRERFNCSLEEIIFNTLSHVDVCSFMQLVALAENVRLESEDVSSLLRLSGGDVRRCLLQLQLWVQSGGGRASQTKEPIFIQRPSVTERGDNADSHPPQCDTGCAASMLGLHLATQNQLLNLLKRQFWSDTDMIKLLRLLAESWRGGVPLLYSNLELLLPIEAKGTSVHFPNKGSGLQLEENISPKVSATDGKSVRKLNRRKYTTTFDTTSASSPQKRTLSSKRAPSSRHETEQNATDCLDALTDFFDLMSYLDATTPAAAPLVSGSCGPEAFAWTGAEIKDGFLDEMSEEEQGDRSRSQESLSDFQAAVEGLGCHRCCLKMSQAHRYRQELGDTTLGRLEERPTSSKRQSLSFSSQPLCPPSVSQRRYELSRMVLCNKSFSLLGNRRAVSVDYMPVLRYICRFQREQHEEEEPIRCINYLSSKHLGLSKSTIQLLAEDFS